MFKTKKHFKVYLLRVGLFLSLVLFCLNFAPVKTPELVQAAAGINRQISFQGKLVNPNGTNVTDGSYTIVFSIYSVSSGGSAIWTETQTPTLSNGIFQVNLGSVTPLPGSVDFDTDNIYLGIKVGADAEMTPRIRFTAVPQAFNSEKLGGLDKTGFIQNGTSQQASSNFNISGTGVVGTSLTTPTLQSAAATALTITGNAASTWSTTAGDLTIQAGSGTVSLGTSTALGSNGNLSIQATGYVRIGDSGTPGVATADDELYVLGDFEVDANTDLAGTLAVGGNTTLTGDLAVNGGDITSTGALTLTPAAGSNVNVTTSGAGDFAVNTSQLYVDSSTASVGIGTSAPSTKLQVQSATTAAGTAGTEELFKLSRPINGGVSYPQAASFALGTYSTNGAGNGFGPDTRLDIKLKSTSTNDDITDVTVLTLQDNGNIGIGTTAPGYLLDVRGTNSSQIHLGGLSTDTGGYLLGLTGNGTYMSTDTAFNGTNWVAKATSANIFGSSTSGITYFNNTGLTAGNTFTPTARWTVDTSGNTTVAGTYLGQTISSTANFTGTVAVATSVTTPLLTSTAGLGITGGTTVTIASSGAGNDIIINGADILDVQDATTFASTATFNGVATHNTDTDFTLAGTENVGVTSDLAGTVDVLSVTGTPSASAGTTRGLVIQQANSANTNGLDTALLINNSDTDLAVTTGIQFTSSGGGFTNFLDTPSIDLTGTGAITGATGVTSSGAITFSGLSSAGIVTNTAGGVLGTTTTVPIANGGTGQATSQAAINALSQLTTNGDLLYHNGTNSTRLARGSDTQCLTSNATTIVWGSCSTGGANTALSNLASVAINTSLIAGSNDTLDLGSNALRWRDLYLGGETINIGTSLTDQGAIGYNTTTNVLSLSTDTTTNGAIALNTNSTSGVTMTTTTATAGRGLLVAKTFTGTSSADRGVYVTHAVNPSGASSADSYALSLEQNVTGTALALSGNQRGINNQMNISNTGTTSNVAGMRNRIINSGAGTITSAYGVQGFFESTSTGTIGNAYNFHAQAPSVAAGGAITNAYGLYIEGQDAANVGTGYGVYQAGTADLNYFAGRVGVGDATPDYQFDVEGTSTAISGSSILSSNALTVSPASAPAAPTSYIASYTAAVTADADVNANTILYGQYAVAQNNGAGALGTAVGISGFGINSAGGGVTTSIAILGQVQNSGAGTTGTGVALYGQSPSASAGAITTAHGLFIAQQDTGAAVGTGYGVYQAGTTDLNHFAGTVGIGTVSAGTGLPAGPGYKLHVQESGATQDIAVAIETNNSTAGADAKLGFYRSRGTSGVGRTIVNAGDNLANIIAHGYDGTNYQQAARIDFLMDGTPGANDMPGQIQFGTTADGGTTPTTHMVLNSSGSLFVGGSTEAASDFVMGSTGQMRLNGIGANARLTFAPISGGTTNLMNIDNNAGTLRVFRENYTTTGGGGGGVVLLEVQDGGNILWDGSVLQNDAHGGSIELGSAGTTFIDFSNDAVSDYDMRLILSGDDYLTAYGGTFQVENNLEIFGSGGQLIIGDRDGAGNYILYDSGNVLRTYAAGADRHTFWESGDFVASGSLQYGNTGGVSGTAACRATGANGITFGWAVGHCTSLQKYKDNTTDLSFGLETLRQLRAVEFDWNIATAGYAHDLGFIAEEVEAVNPLLAEYTNGELSGVKYNMMSALLTKSVQELDAQTQEQKTQIDDQVVINTGQGAAIADLDSRATTLEDRILEIEQQLQNPTFSSLNIAGDLGVINLSVTGVATIETLTVLGDATVEGNLVVKGDAEVQDLYVNGKLVSKGAVPEVALGDALADVLGAAVTNNGTDTAGTVVIASGSEVAETGVLAEVTFTNPYEVAPKIVISGNNAKSAKLGAYVERTEDGFRIVTDDVVEEGVDYEFDYIIIEAQDVGVNN